MILPREPFNQVLRDQEKAFGNFFGKRAKYPRFRRSGGHEAVHFTLDQCRTQVDRVAGTVAVPGLGSASSKTRFTYGAVNYDLKLSERHWRCAGYGTGHDRDLNAARNIEREGLRILSSTPRSGAINARGVAKGQMLEFAPEFKPSTVELRTCQTSPLDDAFTSRSSGTVEDGNVM